MNDDELPPKRINFPCNECGCNVTNNRVVRLKSSAVAGKFRPLAGARAIIKGDLFFCPPCHRALFASFAMQRRYPELFGQGVM